MQGTIDTSIIDQLLEGIHPEAGGYQWAVKLFSLIAFVLLFNAFSGWVLNKLHSRYHEQHDLWKDALCIALKKPLRAFLWLIAAVLIVNGASQKLLEYSLLPAAAAIRIGLIIAAAWFFFRWKHLVVHGLTERSRKKKSPFELSKIDALNKAATLALYLITALLLIEQLGGSMNTLIAFGGISGLAVAFASQQIIANFFGGIMIYVTQPFAIGDWIRIPDKNVEGHIEEIGWYTTAVLSLNKQPVYIPNSLLTNAIVMNPGRMKHRQFKETIGLRYDDLQKVPQVVEKLKERIFSHPTVDKELLPLVALTAFGPYSIDILVIAFTTEASRDQFAKFSEELLLVIADTVQGLGADFAIPLTGVEFPKGAPKAWTSP